jgi:hypothetical protein
VAGETPARFATSAMVVLGTRPPLFDLLLNGFNSKSAVSPNVAVEWIHLEIYTHVRMMSSRLERCRVQKLA